MGTQIIASNVVSCSSNLLSSNQSIVFSNDTNLNENSVQNSKRKLFTKEEDQLLKIAALRFNQGSWNDIAKCVPGRTPKQCRDRWTNYLQPSLKFDPWTNQEDNNLIMLVKNNGTHWKKMKRYFPGRSTNALKNRWHWLINNQDKSLSNKSILKLKGKSSNNKLYNSQSKNENLKNNFTCTNIGDNYQLNRNNFNLEIINSLPINQNQNYFLGNINQNKIYSNNVEKKDNIGTNLESIKIDQNNYNDIKNNDLFDENQLISINPEDIDW